MNLKTNKPIHSINMKLSGISMILFLLMAPLFGICQPSGPGEGGDGGNPEETGVPFDGGISLLLAAGVAFSAKKMRDQKRKKKLKDEEETLEK